MKSTIKREFKKRLERDIHSSSSNYHKCQNAEWLLNDVNKMIDLLVLHSMLTFPESVILKSDVNNICANTLIEKGIKINTVIEKE